MTIINNCISKLQSSSKKIKVAFVEGHSKRMIEAAHELVSKKLLEPVMIFETKEQFDEVASLVKDLNKIIISEETDLTVEFVKEYLEVRKGKETVKQAEEALKLAQFYAAMLTRTGKTDGALGGVHLSTGDILKAAFKLIGPKEGTKTISSVIIMAKGEDTYLFGDISVNPKPDSKQLADIGQNAVEFAREFNIEEKVAFLSFSTSGSAATEQTQETIEATTNFNSRKCSKFQAIGEVQFDTAFVESIKKQKYKYEHNFDGTTKIFIFPDLNSGNIGYKIAERMGDWSTMGPIITGLNKPFNDLSRGSAVKNVVESAIITATQALVRKEEK